MFKPEEYDAVVYHKDFGDLRLNTNRKKDHVRYRVAFADLLFGEHNLFNPQLQMVTLNPLLGDCAAIFQCKDVPGLAEISLIEVRYASLLRPGLHMTLKAEKDCDLLVYHSLADDTSSSLLPADDAHSITYAKFRYRRRDTTRTDILTVHAGNTLTYERDGDSSVLEDWLRRRRFINYSLPPLTYAAQTAQIA